MAEWNWMIKANQFVEAKPAFRVGLNWLAFSLSMWMTSTAVGKAAEGDCGIIRAGLVQPNILAVTLREGYVTLGAFRTYEAAPDDKLQNRSLLQTIVVRDGKPVGTLSGNEQSPIRFLRTDDLYSGKSAETKRLTEVDAWSILVPITDARSASQTVPPKITNVFRKSRVTDIAEKIEGQPNVCLEHTLFLQCASVIPSGRLTVKSTDPVIEDFEFDFAPTTTLSEAIHVSVLGFRPDDPKKSAFLSCWMGDGGGVDYRSLPVLRFAIVDDRSGGSRFSGTATLLRDSNEPCDHRGLQGRPDGTVANYAGTPTFEMDFSSFEKPGRYRVVVEGIGTSLPFEIKSSAYKPLLDIALQGLRAHRWGEDLVLEFPDGSQLNRPAAVPASDRSYSDVPVSDTNAVYTNANFEDFEPGKIGPHVGSVVGGYMDAGDYDRNHNHWIISYLLLDLAEAVAVKDRAMADQLVEAALWNIDLWMRLQHEDGGVPSAVEYSEHPRKGEPSWLNTLPMYVCAPSAESCLNFASSAAKAASVLSKLGTADGDAYSKASAKAIRWAQQSNQLNVEDLETTNANLDLLALALAEQVRAAGREADRMRLLSILDRRAPEPWSMVYPNGLGALVTLLEIDRAKSKLSGEQRQRFEGAVKRTIEANYLEGSYRRSSFRGLKNGWVGTTYGSAGWPTNDAAHMMRAWRMFGDKEYLSAAVAGIGYAAGGNPNNMVYITGMHERSVKNALHCDSRYCGKPAPVGVPVYGPGLPVRDGSAWPLNWHLAGERSIYPAYEQWPTYENVHEFWSWAMPMEYTVHQTSASIIYFAGMLHYRD